MARQAPNLPLAPTAVVASLPAMSTDKRLRREIRQLGRMFGDVVRHFEGDAAFELIETVRRDARKFTEGDAAAADRLNQTLSQRSTEELRIVVRAFSTFLELANLAEDRQRVRILRARERDAYPGPYRESLRDAICRLHDQERSSEELQELLGRIHVELVFTAHPTEAKRKSLRSKLRQIRRFLAELDSDQLTPREESILRRRLRGELEKLWLTDMIRHSRPTVLHEVQRGLSFQPVLWATVPLVFRDLREAVPEYFPGVPGDVPPLLAFGSWMGGDRDGHPFVTAEITAQTCVWLRQAAIESHLEVRRVLADSLSLSQRQSHAGSTLDPEIEAACQRWPEVKAELEEHGRLESFRRWLRVVRWRLERTAVVELTAPPPPGCYASADELADDIRKIRAALRAGGSTDVAKLEVDSWLDQIEVFGFHTTRLDIRQHANVYRGVIDELWRSTGHVTDATNLSEVDRQRMLVETLMDAGSVRPATMSDTALQTLELFRTLRRVARNFGMAALGGHVVSMTHYPSDLLTVLWLWKWSEQTDGGHPRDPGLHLPVVPLFETISDLHAAGEILATVLEVAPYRDAVHTWGDRQIVMIGYSDSTKDGGYLAACWGVQQAQIELQEVADRYGVKLTFFHGRGGSLGRGGGPAARAILSLPPAAFDGTLRLTEQGEILAERYDDPHIARRHLEQVMWSVLVASMRQAETVPDAWSAIVDALSEDSHHAYRELIEHPAFGRLFRGATPISDIEGLRIASRPSRRAASDRIEDLRAIPWVFAWTQCRCLLPAWYGLGSALARHLDSSPNATDDFRQMIREWPFLRATISNAVLAVAKSNRPVFRHYVHLVAGEPGVDELVAMIEREWSATEEVLRTVTDCQELLDDVPWLKRSIAVRNGYVDPLNLIQVELMRRGHDVPPDADSSEVDELTHVKQLVVKGIAAGMRTTG